MRGFLIVGVLEICDKKNQVLFTDIECLVLSKDFKLLDDSMVVLKVPRKHNLYAVNLNDLCPRGNLACLVAHAFFDESVKWHRRMAHVNYKNMNRLVKGNLVRGLPPKLFKNGHTCVACCKGKQHKTSYKAINAVSSIFEPLQLLHMDLFVATSIRSIDHKYYYLVITDDYSRFCWVLFLAHKDETYPILKDFINLVENQLNKKVKAIRCDNGTEFKNAHMIELCGSKGIKREYSNLKTLQQNRVAKRKNRTLIEAARTLLADSKLPTMFWTEAADEGYIVGYSASNKAYRVYNVPNKRVEESMNLWFLEEKSNVQGLGHEWYFDLDYLTDSLCYKHVSSNQPAGTQGATTNFADTSGDKVDDSPFQSVDEIFQKELASATPVPPGYIPVPSCKVPVPTGSLLVLTSSIPGPAAATMVPSDDVPVHTSSSNDSMFNGEHTTRFLCPSDLGNHDPSPRIFSSSSYDDELDTALNNVASSMEVSLMATKRINTIHPQSLIIGDPTSAVQTRSKVKQNTTGDSAFISYIFDQQRDNHTDFQHCLFACFLSQVKPRSVVQALEDPSWVDAMQEEMQQFKFQNVWVLVDFPAGFLVYQMDVKSVFFIEELMRKYMSLNLKVLWILNIPRRSTRTKTTPYEATKPKSKNESDSPVKDAQSIVAMIDGRIYVQGED
nr:putative ribonuclease H-like domain-containing protein [Tanacetum cinerariifolium]